MFVTLRQQESLLELMFLPRYTAPGLSKKKTFLRGFLILSFEEISHDVYKMWIECFSDGFISRNIGYVIGGILESITDARSTNFSYVLFYRIPQTSLFNAEIHNSITFHRTISNVSP
ncbi:hypothetical protein TNIN_272511 [Trichonephila inaurata madagascariensis]|uniref:Uncharacterized protein n=1 Tax=Trichonephila inaurata madagascariensis TaxID=2747483 RepID=A0A8X7C1A2_9ARAC|nr:hypothetical protein TNIN_272511 [Trichonephila inaurata madagascariensis]